jgi:hypothetical protein
MAALYAMFDVMFKAIFLIVSNESKSTKIGLTQNAAGGVMPACRTTRTVCAGMRCQQHFA